ncbi:MAG: 16S rRNA (cytosine(1402)-N(4))-methyltransferase RsmH [Pseudomonadota bacterium]|jgi:16S rRNA (cytosine1402-N4)-methyltransferase|nr:16S rRNA (cytosine(1402)-N(4))-methyltransferase RsmH [Pseudomonadota bacterium]
MYNHQPVLVAEALEGLAVNEDGWYVDGTYGRGGHSIEILARLGKHGKLLALDKDPEAVEHARHNHATDPRFSIKHGGFEHAHKHVALWLEGRPLAGLLLDLGVSSPQLQSPERGFSFIEDGPLDMRMNPTEGITAEEWLRQVNEAELVDVLRRFGEEPRARQLSRAILRARAQAPITTTGQLAEIIASASSSRPRRINPATRAFQAIRIHVNKELKSLESGLDASLDLLAVGGRLCVISFHSLEDRIVKRFMARQAKGDPAYAGLPEIPLEARPTLKLIAGLIRPTQREVDANPKSRSARLRIAEKLGTVF